MKNGKFLTLAIESSCDETSVAVMADGRQVMSNIISSQIDIHEAEQKLKDGTLAKERAAKMARLMSGRKNG